DGGHAKGTGPGRRGSLAGPGPAGNAARDPSQAPAESTEPLQGSPDPREARKRDRRRERDDEVRRPHADDHRDAPFVGLSRPDDEEHVVDEEDSEGQGETGPLAAPDAGDPEG